VWKWTLNSFVEVFYNFSSISFKLKSSSRWCPSLKLKSSSCWCLQARQNQASEIGKSLHTGGSITIHEHAICMVSVPNKVCLYFFITYINHVIYKRRNWVVDHILMKFVSKLIYKRVMVNLWMNNLGKHM